MDEKQLIDEIAGMFREQNAHMDRRINDLRQEILITIENDITKRLDTLTDGYQLVHEKQWELERRMQRLEQRLDELTA